MRQPLRIPVLIAGLLAFPPASSAQPIDGGYREQVELDVVEVDVRVVDTAGQPVTGLGPDDFELLVDGRPVSISQLYELGAPDAAPAADGAGPAARAFAGPITLGVLVDDLSSTPALRQRSLGVLEPLIDALPRGSAVVLARHEDGVEIVLAPTSDLAAAKRELTALFRRPTRGALRVGEEQRVLEEIVHVHEMYVESPQLGACSPDEVADILLTAQTFGRKRRLDAEAGLRAPVLLARTLGQLGGRRLLIYVSGGVETTPGRRIYEAIRQLCPESALSSRMVEERDISASVERAAEAVAASGVTFYSLDAAGRDIGPTLGANLPFGLTSAASSDLVDRQARQDVLFAFARDSGGEAFLDLARPEELSGRLVDALNSGYSLGYVPDHPAEGKSHRLEVRVKRPGCQVRHRLAFAHRTAREISLATLQAALTSGQELTVLGASVQVGRIAPREGEKKRFDVSLWLRVPLRELALTPAEGGRLSGDVHFQLSGRDERDRETTPQAVDVPLSVPPDRVASGDFLYEIRAVMREGVHRLAVRVEDRRSGAADLLSIDVEVAPPG